MSEEKVMVIPAGDFFKRGRFEDISFDVKRYDGLIDTASFMPRGAAENNSNYLQPIPYCIIHWGNYILHYRRGKDGETRLRGKRSIGIGGHINNKDNGYWDGFQREITEELGCIELAHGADDRIKAVIHDPSTPVGQVHLGFVHALNIDGARLAPSCSSIVDPQFVTVDQLRSEIDAYETWSQICIRNIERILKA